MSTQLSLLRRDIPQHHTIVDVIARRSQLGKSAITDSVWTSFKQEGRLARVSGATLSSALSTTIWASLSPRQAEEMHKYYNPALWACSIGLGTYLVKNSSRKTCLLSIPFIMRLTTFIFMLTARSVLAFPFIAEMPGVDSSLLRNGNRVSNEKRQTTCPFNSVHPGAAPYNASYPYTGAQNGLPGTGEGGLLVPAVGDTAHTFEAPGPNDIRGPCPGLNTAANHHVSYSIGATCHSLNPPSS